jgi:hypothetical protein
MHIESMGVRAADGYHTSSLCVKIIPTLNRFKDRMMANEPGEKSVEGTM